MKTEKLTESEVLSVKEIQKLRADIIEKYGLKSARVYSDDGPENHGEVEAVLKGSTFEQVFANFKLGKSNNMIEALNKKFKRFVLLNFSFETPSDLEALLPQMVDYYNNILVLVDAYGLTTVE